MLSELQIIFPKSVSYRKYSKTANEATSFLIFNIVVEKVVFIFDNMIEEGISECNETRYSFSKLVQLCITCTHTEVRQLAGPVLVSGALEWQRFMAIGQWPHCQRTRPRLQDAGAEAVVETANSWARVCPFVHDCNF